MFAQSPALPSSGLEWRAPAHPLKYFDATGHRAAAFGRQTGVFEAWIYPIKVLHGFRLEFQQEGMVEPVRSDGWLQEIIARPESTTLIYAHPLFTVRQTIWAPLDEPAVVQFLEVDTAKPLFINAKFVPDLKPMWPAALGGQHSDWTAQEKAFELTDATQIATALLGSPAVDRFTEFLDHQLIGGEMLLRLRMTPEQARNGPLMIVMTLGMGKQSGERARATYRNVVANARELYAKRVETEKQYVAKTSHLETPDPELNRNFEWAKVAIHSGWVCRPENHAEIAQLSGVPDVQGPDCGLIAGYGPSGEGERPGFAWWFGGDAMMSTWALEDVGDLEGALAALRFLKARQRADGKMMHEMSQSVDLVDWFGKYNFAYYHADTTPMYLYSLARYFDKSTISYWNDASELSGDRKFLQEFWPSAKKAYEYCVSTLDPADGLMDNTKAGLAAVEVGVLRGKVVKDIYLEGFWIAGLEGMRSLAFSMHDNEMLADVEARLRKATTSLNHLWWNPEGKYFAFGITADGKRADMLGVWPSVLLGLTNIQWFGDKADLQVAKFATPELATDWGDRWLSSRDPLYDPVSYNNGTVWPFLQTFVALAQRGLEPLSACVTVRNTMNLTGLQSPGALPEHMNGDRFLPGERSVPHQLFSSVAVIVGAQSACRNLYAEPIRLVLGLGVLVPAPLPGSGERSAGLKIIHTTRDRDARTLTFTLAGLGGQSYSLDLITNQKNLTAKGASVEKTARGYRLRIAFDGEGYVTKSVEIMGVKPCCRR